MRNQLDFEKPIVELQNKLAELKKHPETHSMDISFDEEVALIEKKIEEERRRIYSTLSAWDRVKIARHPKIVAVKDATGNLGRVSDQRLKCGEDFIQLSGNDDMALGFNAMGGVGCISVTANVAPRLCSDFQKAMREKRWDDALKLQDRLYPLHAALFTDASPAPTKYALSRLKNDFPAELRLPLVEASAASKKAVDAALEHAGLI